MTLFHLILFAIVQGITEFLPISSSGHLILLHQWTGATADALALDVAVHLGSILAVILYFRAEVARAARGGWSFWRPPRLARQLPRPLPRSSPPFPP
jgi:undecaprenyl-diphosphatase